MTRTTTRIYGHDIPTTPHAEQFKTLQRVALEGLIQRRNDLVNAIIEDADTLHDHHRFDCYCDEVADGTLPTLCDACIDIAHITTRHRRNQILCNRAETDALTLALRSIPIACWFTLPNWLRNKI